jgi:16S rRNA (guanine527-N7)-methyltransferase
VRRAALRSYNAGMNDAARATQEQGLQQRLRTGLDALGIDAAHAEALLDYLALLERWNRTYNLTAIRDIGEMVDKHLLDSLAMHAHVADVARLADLGTGPGLPGIPLAIVHPHLQVALVESNGKKARFLREAVRRLGLRNAEVVESRIEAFDAPGRFDAITARALATLPLILELGGHLLDAQGRLLAMKGVAPDDEIAALPAGWRVQAIHALQVPGLEAERHLVVVGRG